MNVKDAYVIAHASPFEDEIPDYLVDDFQMPMKFKSIEEATNFILSIAPIGSRRTLELTSRSLENYGM